MIKYLVRRFLEKSIGSISHDMMSLTVEIEYNKSHSDKIKDAFLKEYNKLSDKRDCYRLVLKDLNRR